jgi:iron(III) transport system substrate-binding protein
MPYFTIPRSQIRKSRASKRKRRRCLCVLSRTIEIVASVAQALLNQVLSSRMCWSTKPKKELFMKFKFSLALISVALFIASPVLAQSSNLVEAAKKEGGKVVVYGSLESDIMAAVIKAFEKKTGLDVEYWRASATQVMDRALSEYRAGKPLFDVVLTNTNPMRIMQQDGIFARYQSPMEKDYPSDIIDPTLGPMYRHTVVGIIYNTSLIKPADAPKSLEDLLKPQYHGKLVMSDPSTHTTTTQWIESLYKVMGKEKAEKFVRDLAATKPILVASFLPAARQVSTGQTPIGITYVKYVYIYGKEGAPLDYVRLPEMLGDGEYIDLSNKAPHPDAGKAFMDFFLSNESQKIMAQQGEFVTEKDLYPPLPGADKIHFVQLDELSTKQYASLKQEYEKLFVR